MLLNLSSRKAAHGAATVTDFHNKANGFAIGIDNGLPVLSTTSMEDEIGPYGVASVFCKSLAALSSFLSKLPSGTPSSLHDLRIAPRAAADT